MYMIDDCRFKICRLNATWEGRLVGGLREPWPILELRKRSKLKYTHHRINKNRFQFSEVFVQLRGMQFHIFCRFIEIEMYKAVLGDPEVTANIFCKSRNLSNKDTQNYSTDLR